MTIGGAQSRADANRASDTSITPRTGETHANYIMAWEKNTKQYNYIFTFNRSLFIR